MQEQTDLTHRYTENGTDEPHHGKHVSTERKVSINFPLTAFLSTLLVMLFGALYVIADAYTKVCPDPSYSRCADIPFGQEMTTLVVVFFAAGILALIAGIMACIECFIHREGEGWAYTSLVLMALASIFAGGGIASHILQQIIVKIT